MLRLEIIMLIKLRTGRFCFTGQSFTALMPLLTATSAFGLRRRRWSSGRCYLHRLCTTAWWPVMRNKHLRAQQAFQTAGRRTVTYCSANHRCFRRRRFVLDRMYGFIASVRRRSITEVNNRRDGKKVKVKASHTRYRALGPELILVYRQSACRWP